MDTIQSQALEIARLKDELAKRDQTIAELKREISFLKHKLKQALAKQTSPPDSPSVLVVPPLPTSPPPAPPASGSDATTVSSEIFAHRGRSHSQPPEEFRQLQQSSQLALQAPGSDVIPRKKSKRTSSEQDKKKSKTASPDTIHERSASLDLNKAKHRSSKSQKRKSMLLPQYQHIRTEQIVLLQALIRGYLARQQVKERVAKQRAMLTYTTTEVLTSEQRYCDSLLLVIKNFKKPLEANSDIISEKDVQAIFLNIEEIYSINDMFLVYVKRIFENHSSSPVAIAEQLGLCFLQMAPEWKSPYSTYCNLYAKALECLESCKQKKAFSTWLKKAESIPEMSKLGLVDFLIKPVKRIPQYELLLNQIKKHLNKGSKAHQTVRTAKLIIRELATWINEKKKNFESAAKISELATRIYGRLPNLRSSGRNFINETVVLEKTNPTEPLQKRLVLFSDCLLISNITGKFDRLVYLFDAKLKESKETDELVLEIENQDNVFLFSSASEAKQWSSAIQACLKHLKELEELEEPIRDFIRPDKKERRASVIQSKIEKEGWLYKSSGGSWHRRWFTLEQGVLFYYKSKPNPEDTFSGYIDLNLYFLSEDPKYTTRRKYCMRLHNIKYKTWFLATDTDEARKEWIAAMMPYTLFGKKSSNKDLVPPSDPNSDLIRFDDEPATPTSTNAGPVLSPMSADSFSPERFDWVDPDERTPPTSPTMHVHKNSNNKQSPLRRSVSWDKSMFDKFEKHVK